jgi:hypothetical protein
MLAGAVAVMGALLASLAARTYFAAVASSIALWLGVAFFPLNVPLRGDLAENGIHVLLAVLFVLQLIRPRLNIVTAVAAYGLVYLSATAIATNWLYGKHHYEPTPWIAASPMWWQSSFVYQSRIFMSGPDGIGKRPWIDWIWGGQNWYHGYGSAYLGVASYWAACLFTLWWGRRWMIRHFDALVGRGAAPERRISIW